MPLTFSLGDWIQIAVIVGLAFVAWYRLDELSKQFASFKDDYVTKEVHRLQIELVQLQINNLKTEND